ncbi:MAG: PSP1 domain-containing protein [Bacteriovoracaceae bacterium]
MEDLNDGETLVDLGAGYAKGSLLCQALGFKKTCVSLELSRQRIQHSKNIAREKGLDPGLIRPFDLRNGQIPLAQAYFVYLPLGELIFKPLESLLDRKHPCVFYVVESHGDVIDFFESLSWFKLEKVLTSASPRHKMGVYKFRFSPQKIIEALDINSYQLIYWLLQNYSKSPSIGLVKENASAQVSASDLTPLKYNGQMMFESLSLKRIVDFKNVYVSSAALGGSISLYRRCERLYTERSTKENKVSKNTEEKRYFCARVMADTNIYVVELGDFDFKYGREVVIKTEFGEDLAFISSFLFANPKKEGAYQSGRMLGYATEEDRDRALEKLAESRIVRKKIEEVCQNFKLKMNITHVLLPLKGKSLVIYYTAKSRVDFRELLKRLRGEFKQKIVMRQIGSRDRMDSFVLDSRIPLNSFRISS